MAILRGAGLELELLADPRALGLPLPDASQHPPVAAAGLPVRPHLPPGHHRVPDASAVRQRGRHHRESWAGRGGGGGADPAARAFGSLSPAAAVIDETNEQDLGNVCPSLFK